MDSRLQIEYKNDETCYFSALENLEGSFEQLEEEEEEEEEKYYTRLRFDTMNKSRTYTSLKFPKPDYESTANDSIISGILQAEELGLNYESDSDSYSMNYPKKGYIIKQEPDEGFDDDDYAILLDHMKAELIKNFEKKLKSKKARHINLDQTIEECFDEVEYENSLDDLIKSCAKSKIKRNSANRRKAVQRNETKCTCNCKCKISNTKEQKVTEKALIEDTVEEYPMLKHVFILIESSSLIDFMPIVKDFKYKMLRLISNGSELVKLVGHVFICLLDLDLRGLILNFIDIPVRDKWNVLKNLIYYAIKITLISVSELFLNDCKNSFLNILNSIYSYVKNFERITF